MASVVYEGVGGGGTLFEGMKFFLVQRIPTREYWKTLIEANGGQVLKLDKNADYIIADHARKDVPPGSISWKFLDESVKKGELADIEDHRAGRPAGTIRESGSAQPPRKGRTQFTAEDDRILMEWCVKAERQGLSVKGNDLFKQLEEKNNRHTFQSWRDRWVKYLSSRPRPALAEDGEDEDEQDDEPPAQNGPTFRVPINRRYLPAPAVRPRSTPAPSSSSTRPLSSRIDSERKAERTPAPAPSRSAKPAPNDTFTAHETELLEEEYEAILDISSDEEIDAWQTWAAEYPSHTAQEWRNYFKEYLVPKMKSLTKKSSKKPREISPLPLRRPKKATAASSSSSKPVSVQTQEVQDSQDPPAPLKASPQGAETELQRAISDEEFFRERLTKWEAELREEGNSVRVDFLPKICGRPIPLFRLWQVVLSEEFGGFDKVDGLRLWQRVARALNFNDFKLAPAAAQELRDCYSDLLADLEEVIRDVDGPDPTESQERAMLDAQLFETAAHETQDQDEEEGGEIDEEPQEPQELLEEEEEEEEDDDDLDAPQYLPHLLIRSSSSKRSFGSDRTNLENSYNKRQRIDKGKGKELEIPSTPEDIINSNQAPRSSLPKPSPLKNSTIKQEDEEEAESSEIEELIVPVPFKLPAKPKSKPTPEIAEPETQDFHYPQIQFESNIKDEEEEPDSFADFTFSPHDKAPERSSGSNAAHRGSDPVDSSTQSQTESDLEKQKYATVMEYIDYRVSLGYTEEAAILALEYTTMEKGPHCDQVMEALESGLEVPDYVAGVWTASDDVSVEKQVESAEFKDMVRKHGIARCHARRAWLVDSRR